MTMSTENVPSYAKWPTVGIGVGAAVAVGTHGLNLLGQPDVVARSPRTLGLKTGALATMLVFDALALKDLKLPGDRNGSAVIGAGVGATMLGGTAGAATSLFAKPSHVDYYGTKPADEAAGLLRRLAGTNALRAASAGVVLGAIGGAVFAGKGADR